MKKGRTNLIIIVGCITLYLLTSWAEGCNEVQEYPNNKLYLENQEEAQLEALRDYHGDSYIIE